MAGINDLVEKANLPIQIFLEELEKRYDSDRSREFALAIYDSPIVSLIEEHRSSQDLNSRYEVEFLDDLKSLGDIEPIRKVDVALGRGDARWIELCHLKGIMLAPPANSWDPFTPVDNLMSSDLPTDVCFPIVLAIWDKVLNGEVYAQTVINGLRKSVFSQFEQRTLAAPFPKERSELGKTQLRLPARISLINSELCFSMLQQELLRTFADINLEAADLYASVLLRLMSQGFVVEKSVLEDFIVMKSFFARVGFQVPVDYVSIRCLLLRALEQELSMSGDLAYCLENFIDPTDLRPAVDESAILLSRIEEPGLKTNGLGLALRASQLVVLVYCGREAHARRSAEYLLKLVKNNRHPIEFEKGLLDLLADPIDRLADKKLTDMYTEVSQLVGM